MEFLCSVLVVVGSCASIVHGVVNVWKIVIWSTCHLRRATKVHHDSLCFYEGVEEEEEGGGGGGKRKRRRRSRRKEGEEEEEEE